MTIDFYYSLASGPCRVVLLVANAIGVPLNKKILDLQRGEHLTPDFLKLNPQHTVPTINDNGFSLWESRAIITYLQNQYGKDDSLYPKDPKKRAVVDQRLYFDIGTLFVSLSQCYFPAVFRGTSIDQKKVEDVDKALKFLDTFLGNSAYVAGDKLTLADFSAVVTVSTIEIFAHDLSPYKNIGRWYSKVKNEIPEYEELNVKGLAILKQMIDRLSKK